MHMTTVQHDHREFVPGCFRCDLSRQEVPHTLSDFLLARIAEDEEVARESRQYEHTRYYDSPVLHWRRDESGYGQIIATSGRVLAECEAKRRIVEQWCATQPPASGADYAVEQELELVLMQLALPYADHPDYRQEWKP